MRRRSKPYAAGDTRRQNGNPNGDGWRRRGYVATPGSTGIRKRRHQREAASVGVGLEGGAERRTQANNPCNRSAAQGPHINSWFGQ